MLPKGYISPITKEERTRVLVLEEMDPDGMTLDDKACFLIMGIEQELKSGTLYWEKETGRVLTWPQEIILAFIDHRELVVKEVLN